MLLPSFLTLIMLVSLSYSASSVLCKTCDNTFITTNIEPSIAFTSKVNVTAQLMYITVPSASDPKQYIDDLQSGKIDVNKLSGYIPTGPLPNASVEFYYRQEIGGEIFESQHCNATTDTNGKAKCEIDLTGVGTQGCGSIYVLYTGTGTYYNATNSMPYCMRYVIPFGVLLGPECFTIIIFFGLLIAGMYATGRNPMAAFEIVKPKAKSAPPTYPIFKYKRYNKWQVNETLGGITRKLSLSRQARTLDSLSKKLLVAGVLSTTVAPKDASKLASLSSVEKASALLFNPDLVKKVERIKRVQLVNERRINALSVQMKKATGFKKETLAASLQLAKEEQVKAEESLSVYNKLLAAHLKIIKSAGAPEGLLDIVGKIYNSKLNAAALGTKINPVGDTLNFISSSKEISLYSPILRANALSEEVVSSAVLYVYRNQDKLSEIERKEFQKLTSTKNADQREKQIFESALGKLPSSETKKIKEITDEKDRNKLMSIAAHLQLPENEKKEIAKQLESFDKMENWRTKSYIAMAQVPSKHYDSIIDTMKKEETQLRETILGYVNAINPKTADDIKELLTQTEKMKSATKDFSDSLMKSKSKKKEDTEDFIIAQNKLLDIYKISASLREQVQEIQKEIPSFSQAASGNEVDRKEAEICARIITIFSKNIEKSSALEHIKSIRGSE